MIDLKLPDLKISLLLFVLQILIDSAYCIYTKSVAQNKPLKAAISGASIHFFLAIGVINYVKNYFYVVPIALGSFVGTYFILKFSDDEF